MFDKSHIWLASPYCLSCCIVVVADADIVAGVSVDDGADVCRGPSTFIVVELFATSCQTLK